MRFYIQPRLNASFVSLGTRSDAFNSVRFARKWNAFQTRFEAKNFYMGVTVRYGRGKKEVGRDGTVRYAGLNGSPA